jgi:hypothetical protein
MNLLPKEDVSLTTALHELVTFELGCIDAPPCFSLQRTDAYRWQLAVNLINGLVASGLALVDMGDGLDHLPPEMIHDMCHFDPYQEIRHQTGSEWLSLCNLIPTERLISIAQATALKDDDVANIRFLEAVFAHMAARGFPLEKIVYQIHSKCE